MAMRRKIAYLPDFPAAFPTFTVLRHIGMVLALYGVERTTPEERKPRRLDHREQIDTVSAGKIDNPVGNVQSWSGAGPASMSMIPDSWSARMLKYSSGASGSQVTILC